MPEYLQEIANHVEISPKYVSQVLQLFEQDATIPFIARYRKEQTGSLDETQLLAIEQAQANILKREKRRATIQKTLLELGVMTLELNKELEAAQTLEQLEDLYLPYKKKRKTRAEEARKKGLGRLAKMLWQQRNMPVRETAKQFLGKEVLSIEEALQGAEDIVAEDINENMAVRQRLRQFFQSQAYISSKVKKTQESEEKYRNYFDHEERLKQIPSHRLLALRRGEEEGVLRVKIRVDEEEAIQKISRILLRRTTTETPFLLNAITDAYKRLLLPSMETEFSRISKEKADKEAIKVFSSNLEQLLLSAPLGAQNILAIDPGFKSGCKLVCLNKQGDLLHNETIYPHPPQSQRKQAMSKLSKLVETYNIEAIAIGNGTAGRDTEQLIANTRFSSDIQAFMVDESGASIYSASSIAREEFPQYDVTVRGAVSIGRRLMDPLSELVKIDPKAIGVGQYQHDVQQDLLKKNLDEVVIRCVNRVGVEVNTASKYLLKYVSGLGEQLAQNIVDYRTENGAFSSREELKKVKRMGAKTFEQCAGFLRIANAQNPLDNSAIHPERYELAEKMAKEVGCTVPELMQQEEKRSLIDLNRYVSESIGLPSLQDIKNELAKPGRDPRKKAKVFQFLDHIRTLNDLQEGMQLPGIVTNITNFGAFVDLGIKENGLIHKSEMADRFVKDPNEIVSLHQQLYARVKSIDVENKRIQLSLKGLG